MDLDPTGNRLPIKVDCATNGEYAPEPLTPLTRAANSHARRQIREAARRVALDRRTFLKRLTGSATTLVAFNQPAGIARTHLDRCGT